MITREQIPSVLDHAVYDTHGNKIGDAKHIFLDDVSGRPEWASVRTGMFGTRESFVPIRDATLVDDHLEVPFDKAMVKDAPSVDVDAGGHLSAEEEHRLYEYYGVDWDASWQQADQSGETGGTAAGEAAAAAGPAAGTTERAAPEDIAPERMPTEESTAEQAPTMGASDVGEAALTRSEERMRVGTERREIGHARLRKYVVTEEAEQTVPLSHEEVRVEREPISESERATMSAEIGEEQQQDVTLHAERPVIETETVPVERVRLNLEEKTEHETVRGQVRKERIDVELPEEGMGPAAPESGGRPERGGGR